MRPAHILLAFEEAAILTVDGVGEWVTSTCGVGKGNDINIQKEIHFPHSLGLLYSAFTAFLGFEVNEGEYKVMGMAPYGVPRYEDKVWKYDTTRISDGSFSLDHGLLQLPSFHGAHVQPATLSLCLARSSARNTAFSTEANWLSEIFWRASGQL